MIYKIPLLGLEYLGLPISNGIFFTTRTQYVVGQHIGFNHFYLDQKAQE